jgi:hypothetical protein
LNDINLDWAAGIPDRMATFTDAKTFDPSDCSGVSDPPVLTGDGFSDIVFLQSHNNRANLGCQAPPQ